VHVSEVDDMVARAASASDLVKEKVRTEEVVKLAFHALDLSGSALKSDASAATRAQYDVAVNKALAALEAFSGPATKVLDTLLADRSNHLQKTGALLLAVVLVIVLASVGIGWAVIRSIADPLRRAMDAADAVKNGRLDYRIEVEGSNETSMLLSAFKEMQRSLTERNERDAITQASSMRIQQALDVTETNVMVADVDYNIVYVNKALRDMLREAEVDLRKDLPRFDAAQVVGTNIDAFHKNPAHQRGLLDRLTGNHKTRLQIGGASSRRWILARPMS